MRPGREGTPETSERLPDAPVVTSRVLHTATILPLFTPLFLNSVLRLRVGWFGASCYDAPVYCEGKDRLFAEYNRCASEWANAVQVLNCEAGTGQGDFERLRGLVDDARAATERAKAAYMDHVAVHRCSWFVL